MAKLDYVLYRKSMEALTEEGIQREFAERVFSEWRDLYITALCKHIRLCNEAKRAGLQTVAYPPAPQWCNAAILILTHGDLMLQDYFMRADEETKNQLVEAVVHDSGITDLRGYFSSLPPIS